MGAFLRVALVVFLFGCDFEHGTLLAGGGTEQPDAGGAGGAELQTSTFQQGVVGYAGTQDTFLDESAVNSVRGDADTFEFDLDADKSKATVGLLRFDGIFDVIPAGATIISATVTVDVIDSGDSAGQIHPALVDWSQSATTWDNFGGDPGVQADEIGAMIAPERPDMGMQSFDATSSVAAWSRGEPNRGWVIVATSSNGVDMSSSESAELPSRPSLVVHWQR